MESTLKNTSLPGVGIELETITEREREFWEATFLACLNAEGCSYTTALATADLGLVQLRERFGIK